MVYAYSEKFVLVLSHDEVVHGKRSMVEKMPGTEEQKLANLKTAYGFMLGHPGKKLLFMGQEFGQKREWSEERELDWELLGMPQHKHMQEYVQALLRVYRGHSCLYELDTKEEGFEWIEADNEEESIFSFVRHSKDGRDNLLFVCNFTPVDRLDYRVGVTKKTDHTILLDSTWEVYGEGQIRFKPEKIETNDRPYSIAYPLKGYACAIFKF